MERKNSLQDSKPICLVKQNRLLHFLDHVQSMMSKEKKNPIIFQSAYPYLLSIRILSWFGLRRWKVGKKGEIFHVHHYMTLGTNYCCRIFWTHFLSAPQTRKKKAKSSFFFSQKVHNFPKGSTFHVFVTLLVELIVFLEKSSLIKKIDIDKCIKTQKVTIAVATDAKNGERSRSRNDGKNAFYKTYCGGGLHSQNFSTKLTPRRLEIPPYSFTMQPIYFNLYKV